MNGLELSRAFYNEYGAKMIDENFADYKNKIACGLVGHGSECFGFDDDYSRDHDFEPGFCIWIDDETEKEIGFRLFREYKKLPNEFIGVKMKKKNSLGSEFKGVHTIKEFYSFYIGSDEIPKTNAHWLNIPDFYLAEATNGEVFSDKYGKFTEIREKLITNRPEDVRLKKLASAVFNMAQYGQYNYIRSIKHGENSAAAVCLSEFCKNTAEAVYLLNFAYAPYYKWLFRGMKKLEFLGDISEYFDKMLSSPFRSDENAEAIEEISSKIAKCICDEELSKCHDSYLEPYAYDITNKIKDSSLRNSPIML